MLWRSDKWRGIRGLPAAALLLLLLALLLPTARAVTFCNDDSDGECEVNVIASDALVVTMGTAVVCADHMLFGTADSTVCPATSPGIYFSCEPEAGGYCNATVVKWGTGLYQLDVVVTGGSSATLTMGGFSSGNYTAKVGETVAGTFAASTLFGVSVPTGSAQRVEFATTTTSTPGQQGGSPPPASTSSGGTAPEPVIVNLPGGKAIADATDSRAGKAFAWGTLVVGGAAIIVAEPHVVPLGPREWQSRKPRRWLTAVGVLVVVLSVLALVPSPTGV